MDSTTIAALIVALATIVAAVLGKQGVFDSIFLNKKVSILIGKWESRWIDFGDNSKKEYCEYIYITR